MTITIHRPVYTGTGYRAMNGSGLALTLEQQAESLEQAIYDVVVDIRAVLGGPGSTITQMLGASAEQQRQIAIYSRGAAALGVLGSMIAPEIGVPLAVGAEVIAIANELDLGGDVAVPDNMPTGETHAIYVGTQPVALPATPPAGYGGGATPAEIWAYNVAGSWPNPPGFISGAEAFEFLYALQQYAMSFTGLEDPRAPEFVWYCDTAWLAFWNRQVSRGSIPWTAPGPVDWSAWNGTDDIVTFLQANEPVYGASWYDREVVGGTPSGYAFVNNPGGVAVYLRCKVSTAMLPYISGRAAQIASPAVPPVWPGQDGVTFGTGVPLAAGVVIEEAMDGIELNILSSARQIPYVGAGSFKLYRSMGRVAFMTDDGYLEAWQPVPANQCVMVPKSMAQASGVVLSFYTGVAGLVTPWTRNV